MAPARPRTRRAAPSPAGGTRAAPPAASRLGPLTDRERTVALAVGAGSSNAEIAAAHHISLATVKAHVSAILTKLDLTNRVQVALLVHDAGLDHAGCRAAWSVPQRLERAAAARPLLGAHDHAAPGGHMDSTDRNRGSAGEEPVVPASVTEPQPTLLDHMDGPTGFVYSTVPVVVFVAANAFLSLTATMIVSIAVALAVTGYRLLRGEHLGLPGRFRRRARLRAGPPPADRRRVEPGARRHARLAGRPGGAARPRRGPRSPRRRRSAFGSGVQQWLYVSDATGWLAVARIAMGWPLTILAALVVVWAFRRSSTRLLTQA